jgi:short-subunit dehydrogenase
MDRIIYITGASSQIGQNLRINLAKSNYKVIICSREKLEARKNESFVHYSLDQGIEPLNGDYEHIILPPLND